MSANDILLFLNKRLYKSLLFFLGILNLSIASAQIDLQSTQSGKSFAEKTQGVTMFRGNPTRTWYGTGPLPQKAPRILWKYPDKPMCSSATAKKITKQWCGNGWTGQPVVWERPDGITEVIVGTYDRAVHFINAETGKATRKPFMTGDLIKGSVTIDPDGFPLLYFGSRDNKLRVVALDQQEPVELWAFDSHETKNRIWDDDWDGNPLILNDYMIEGGENSWFYVFRLNRKYVNGKVSVSPEKLIEMPGWTPELLKALPDRAVSIESSVATFGNHAYFANSGGLITGVDLSQTQNKKASKIFEFWTGDDIDASLVIDDEEYIYAAVEDERGLPQAQKSGQLMKLDPRNSQNPIVWNLHTKKSKDGKGGFWATPALDVQNKILYVPTHDGELWAVDTTNGKILWKQPVGFHAWASPSLIDGFLLQATCSPGGLKLFDVRNRDRSDLVWSLKLPSGGCIESTPVVWKGRIYTGARDGYIYGFGE